MNKIGKKHYPAIKEEIQLLTHLLNIDDLPLMQDMQNT